VHVKSCNWLLLFVQISHVSILNDLVLVVNLVLVVYNNYWHHQFVLAHFPHLSDSASDEKKQSSTTLWKLWGHGQTLRAITIFRNW